MSFQRFIEERGPSYRHCDVFDDLYADIQSQLKDELEQQLDLNFNSSKSLVIKHLKQLNSSELAECHEEFVTVCNNQNHKRSLCFWLSYKTFQ